MILIGNTFPIRFIRRKVVMAPIPLDELRRRVQHDGFCSFWGHENSLPSVTEFLGFDPKPAQLRPALTLTDAFLPCLDGHVFDEVFIISPDFSENFRPVYGEEPSPALIVSWQILKISFV